jgi:hypothetical protein
MCIIEQQKISGCLDLNIFLLKAAAAWPGDISASRWKNSLYICCKIVLGLLASICSFGVMWYCFTVYDSLENVIENVVVLVEMTNLGAKAFSFNVYKKELYYLMESIPRNFFVDVSCHINNVQTPSTVSTINYVRRITIGMPTLYMFTVAAMVSHPLFAQSEDHGQNSSYTSHKDLLFKTWYPHMTDENSYYEIQYLCQTICATFTASFVVATDVTSIALLAYLAFQFQLLNDSVRDMSKNVMLKLKTDTRDRNARSESFKGLEKTGKIGRVSDSPMGNSRLRELQGHRKRYSSGDENDNAGSIQIALDETETESAQREIEAETLRYLKSCIRHHQSLLE